MIKNVTFFCSSLWLLDLPATFFFFTFNPDSIIVNYGREIATLAIVSDRDIFARCCRRVSSAYIILVPNGHSPTGRSTVRVSRNPTGNCLWEIATKY
jgi:hypothetical protein